MEALKKKGNSIKKIITLVWFVFCALSFLFCIDVKASCESVLYRYEFKLGEGHYMNTVINDVSLYYWVEEDTSKPVSDLTRYKIVQKEIHGYKYNIALSGTGKPSNTFMPNMNEDNNVNIYNFLCYGSFVTRKDENAESRKLLKSILFTAVDNNIAIKVEENGTRDYVRYDSSASGNEITRDDDFTEFIWLFDREGIDRDFYSLFNKYNDKNNYSPYYAAYAKESMKAVVNGTEYSLDAFLGDDFNILKIISMEIDKGTKLGNYLSSNVKRNTTEVSSKQFLVWVTGYDESSNTYAVAFGTSKPTPFVTLSMGINGTGDTSLGFGKFVEVNSTNSDYKYVMGNWMNLNKTMLNYFKPCNADGTGANTFGNAFDYNSENGTYAWNRQKKVYGLKGRSKAGDGKDYIYLVYFNETTDPSDTDIDGYYGVYGNIMGSVPLSKVNEAMTEYQQLHSERVPEVPLDADEKKIVSGYEFTFDKDKKEIHVERKTTPSTYMNIDIKNFYSLFYEHDKKAFGLSPYMDPTSFEGTNWKSIGISVNGAPQMIFPTIECNKTITDEYGKEFSMEWSKEQREAAMYYQIGKDSSTQIYLILYDLSEEEDRRRGVGEGEKINHKKLRQLACIDIAGWLRDVDPDKFQEGIAAAERAENRGTLTGNVVTNEEMKPELLDFFGILITYAKPILMFLIFCAIVMISLTAVIDNGNAEKRVLLKEKLKHVLIGALVFSSVFLIIAIASHFFYQASSLVVGGDDKEYMYNLTSVYEADENWLLDLIGLVANAIASLLNWVVDFLGTRLLLLNERHINISDVIYGVENGAGLSLYPFSGLEWSIFMVGYRLLTFIAIALIGVALVKNVIVLIANAGQTEKVTLVREDFLRIIIAILAIVLAPYLVRLILLLVNSLVKLVPVSDVKFDLSFDNYGVVGAFCNLIYKIVEVKVFAAFVVRKIMLVFLLVSTPFIFGAWTISKKIRSMELWIGELLTNAFMQFAYAIVFFFMIMVLANEQNPFVILLLISMMTKLADFVKDSLQGLYSAWGGINETQIAEQGIKKTVDIGKKIYGTGKKINNFVGRNLVEGSRYFDPKGLTKAGRYVHNAGEIMRLNYRGFVSKKDRYANILAEYKSERNKAAMDSKSKLQNLNSLLEVDPYLREKFDDYVRGNIGSKELADLRAKANAYENMGDSTRAKILSGEIKQEDLKQYGLEGQHFGLLADYIDARNKEKQYNGYIDKMMETIDSQKGTISSLQNEASNRAIDSFLSSNSGVQETLEKAQEDLRGKLNDYSKVYDARANNSSDGLDEKLIDLFQDDEKYKDFMKGIIADSYSLSALSCNLKVNPGVNLEIIQTEMSQELSDKFGDYDMERIRQMDSTHDNIQKLKKDLELMSKNIDPENPSLTLDGTSTNETVKMHDRYVDATKKFNDYQDKKNNKN